MPYDAIGFTGTQKGMTDQQRTAVRRFLISNRRDYPTVRHGMCIGADADFDFITWYLGYRIIGHPGVDVHGRPNKRMYGFRGQSTMLEKPYLERNKDIVDSSKILIATPAEKKEQLRSGTWSTIRYARKKKKTLVIIYPDGEIEESKWENGVGEDS